MEQPIKISIYTSVYNTKPYVAQCVESVLNQTYPNFEYIILDNGCTDGSSEILAEYAGRDERIKLIRRKDNQYGFISNIILTCGDGDYMTVLDSDDWLEPQFLERLVMLAAEHSLDMACAGSYIYMESTGREKRYQKGPLRPAVIRPERFQSDFLQYYHYLSALWGKIVRMDVARQAYAEPCIYSTGAVDTVIGFRMLRRSNGIGIDSSALHHYRVRPGSTITTYQPTRFDGTVYLYEQLMDFLNAYGPALLENSAFICANYISDAMETLGRAESASIPPLEKLTEHLQILGHPRTQEIFQRQKESGWEFPIFLILYGLLDTFFSSGLSGEEAGQTYFQLQAILRAVAPRCCPAVMRESMGLFLADIPPARARRGIQNLRQLYTYHHRTALLLFGSHSPLRFLPGNSVPLLQILAEDKPDALLRKLKKLARKRGYAERYALPEAIRMLEQSLKETER